MINSHQSDEKEFKLNIAITKSNSKDPKREPYVAIIHHQDRMNKKVLIKMYFEYSMHNNIKVKLLKPFYIDTTITDDMKISCRRALSQWLPRFNSYYQEYCASSHIGQDASWDAWASFEKIEHRTPFI